MGKLRLIRHSLYNSNYRQKGLQKEGNEPGKGHARVAAVCFGMCGYTETGVEVLGEALRSKQRSLHTVHENNSLGQNNKQRAEYTWPIVVIHLPLADGWCKQGACGMTT